MRALRATSSSQGCLMYLDPRISTVRSPEGPTKAVASSPHITKPSSPQELSPSARLLNLHSDHRLGLSMTPKSLARTFSLSL